MSRQARSLPELLAAGAGGVVVGAVLTAAIDGVFALVGLGRFGDLSGMFAALPAVFVYLDEYRTGRRPALAIGCAALALVLGAGAGYAVSGLGPPLMSGAVAALVAVVVYGTLWYTGSRYLEGAAR